MSQTIYRDYPEYTEPVTITETTGKDISGDTVQIGLGTYQTPPAVWSAGVPTRPSNSSATIKLLIDASIDPGTYWVWIKVIDSPETPARRFGRLTVI